MNPWDAYPANYRSREVQIILRAVQAGECVSVIGLSGSGKSNLLGFLANRSGSLVGSDEVFQPGIHPCLVDCNRLAEFSAAAFFRLARGSLGDSSSAQDEIAALDSLITRRLEEQASLCLLFDRFDVAADHASGAIFSNLRALRDAHKYTLTYVTATRRSLDPYTELAELFIANTLWLGPLSEGDALWNVERYSKRKGLAWDETASKQIVQLSWGYPSLLRAVCEAYASGAALEVQSLAGHPAVRRRVEEFWADHPDEEALRQSGLTGHPLLVAGPMPVMVDTGQLTAKEHLLWEYLQAHPNQVCDKDDLIRGVWPEDRIYERGIRDDSLAQLVRRLREKVEPDPSSPRHIQTVAGRGYRFIP
jgi:energy-coupling factor transporter ATP-binding protein EcfA2